MRPEETGIAPEIRLKSVVFPAPLGPMRARRSPGRTSMLTPSTACRPPKDRQTASRRRAGWLTRRAGPGSAVLAWGIVPRIERRLQVLVGVVPVELADGRERGDHRVLQLAAELLDLAHVDRLDRVVPLVHRDGPARSILDLHPAQRRQQGVPVLHL